MEIKKIELTEEETNLFGYIKTFTLQHQNLLNTNPRVAGGWVRDKILNRKSYDIDITLENITGEAFANSFRTFLQEKKVKTSSLGIVKSNPEKSKHLETAVLNIMGLSVDFLSLRTEIYEESRIPKIKPANIVEDCKRRDLTINSLYYNILTGEIEDFSGRGISDINNKILDTPLPAKQTFCEDPLRILRLFRFFTTFADFEISNQILKALDENKTEAFNYKIDEKVSNERIYKEISKILDSDNFVDGVFLIFHFRFVEQILKLKNFVFERKIDENGFFSKTALFNKFWVENREEIKRYISGEQLKLFKLYSFFTSTYGVRIGKSYLNTKIAKESFCMKKSDFMQIEQIEKNLEFLSNFKVFFSSNKSKYNTFFLKSFHASEVEFSEKYAFIKAIRLIKKNMFHISIFLALVFSGFEKDCNEEEFFENEKLKNELAGFYSKECDQTVYEDFKINDLHEIISKNKIQNSQIREFVEDVQILNKIILNNTMNNTIIINKSIIEEVIKTITK